MKRALALFYFTKCGIIISILEVIVVKVINVDVENFNSQDIIKRKYEMIFLKINSLFYKVLSTKKVRSTQEKEELKILENKVDRLSELNVFDVKNVCLPMDKLYYENHFIGYTTNYLLGYSDLMTIIEFCDVNTKISLLKQVSLALKQLHELGIAHTDIYNDNVMSNGCNIQIIDFDECTIFKKGQNLSYYNSPQADIGAVNDLIMRALKLNTSGRQSVTLPREITNYIKRFDINSEKNYGSDVSASIPSEYPHDWLDELTYYVYAKRNIK